MKKGGNTKINFRPFMGESFYFFHPTVETMEEKKL